MTTTAQDTRRLHDATHRLAEQALSGAWGRALTDLPVTLDDRDDLEDLAPVLRQALGVRLIAEHAPLRILPTERIVGATTLRASTQHVMPIFQDGKPVFPSISHLTPGFDRALALGYRGLRARMHARLAQGDLDAAGIDFLHAMLACLDAAALWHRRHLALLDDLIAASTGEQCRHYQRVRDALARVPEEPPTTFAEAVQALYFLFAFQRLCGNWPGIGRLDVMLGPYLERDLAAGRITLDEARELLAHFWIKGCDWIGTVAWGSGSGDAQYYANIVLGGVDAEGRDVTNAVTDLVLDVVEELGISEFPIAVRLSARAPETLLRRIAAVQRRGGGIVAVYNDDLVIRALVDFGYPERIARGYANDGCWEVQIPGATCFSYVPIDMLHVLQETMGLTGTDPAPDFPDFDSLYAAFRAKMAASITSFHEQADSFALAGPPAPLISLLVDDCIERARGYRDRGTRYTVLSPHAGGLPDTGNSLLAVKQLVYDTHAYTYPALVAMLRADWVGHEEARRRVLGTLPRYGNDDAAADAMTKRVFDDFLALAGTVRERNGVLRPPGVSTFGREIVWRAHRVATPDGHRMGAILATNFSPSPGSDTAGPTAVIRSHCAMDLVRLPNGTALELKMLPAVLADETGLAALTALLRAFLDLGGFFMHIDVVSEEMLRAAQQHPEQYAALAVRVSGWSARFVTLDRDWQEMIIRRTQQAAPR